MCTRAHLVPMFDAAPVRATETTEVPAVVPAVAIALNDALDVAPDATVTVDGLNVMPVAADTHTHTQPRKSGHKHTRSHRAGRRSRACARDAQHPTRQRPPAARLT